MNSLITFISFYYFSFSLCDPGDVDDFVKGAHTGPEAKTGTNLKKDVLNEPKNKCDSEKQEDNILFDVKKLKTVDIFEKHKKIKLISFNIDDINFSDYVIRKSINSPLNYKLTPIHGFEIKTIFLNGVGAWKKDESSVCKDITIYLGNMTFLLFRFIKNNQDLYRVVVKTDGSYKFLSIFEFLVLINQPQATTPIEAPKSKEVKPDGDKTGGKNTTPDKSDGGSATDNDPTNVAPTSNTATVFTGTLDISSPFDKKYFDFRLLKVDNLEVNRYKQSASDIHTLTYGVDRIYTTLDVDGDLSADQALTYHNKIFSVSVYIKDYKPMLVEVSVIPSSYVSKSEALGVENTVNINKYYTFTGDKWIDADAKIFDDSLNTHFKPLVNKNLHRLGGEAIPEKDEGSSKLLTKINLQENNYKIQFSLALDNFKYVKTSPIKKVESIFEGKELVYEEFLEDCEIGWIKGPKIEFMEVNSRDSNVHFVKVNFKDETDKRWDETSQIRFIQIIDKLLSSRDPRYTTITGNQPRILVEKIPELDKKVEKSSFLVLKANLCVAFVLIMVLI